MKSATALLLAWSTSPYVSTVIWMFAYPTFDGEDRRLRPLSK
ncbi:hypothetical protein [Mycobacteroides abscessus]|nr:hypothetical protein [Mycobacteroides abscessus]